MNECALSQLCVELNGIFVLDVNWNKLTKVSHVSYITFKDIYLVRLV